MVLFCGVGLCLVGGVGLDNVLCLFVEYGYIGIFRVLYLFYGY